SPAYPDSFISTTGMVGTSHYFYFSDTFYGKLTRCFFPKLIVTFDPQSSPGTKSQQIGSEPRPNTAPHTPSFNKLTSSYLFFSDLAADAPFHAFPNRF
ncbi:hypothetical protein N9053_02175, partial [bacterium]|nr:hypothetical protein [bacterium]